MRANTATNPLKIHTIAGAAIAQRADGYVNATAMCKARGKKLNDYARLATSKAFIAALSSNAGIPAMDLMQGKPGGSIHSRGTWVHPLVAINLAQWLSPEFAVGVSRLVMNWQEARESATQAPAPLPAPKPITVNVEATTAVLASACRDLERVRQYWPEMDAMASARIAEIYDTISNRKPDGDDLDAEFRLWVSMAHARTPRAEQAIHIDAIMGRGASRRSMGLEAIKQEVRA